MTYVFALASMNNKPTKGKGRREERRDRQTDRERRWGEREEEMYDFQRDTLPPPRSTDGPT